MSNDHDPSRIDIGGALQRGGDLAANTVSARPLGVQHVDSLYSIGMDFYLIGDRGHALDRLSRLFRRDLLGEIFDVAGQRDDAVRHRNLDMSGVAARNELQFVFDLSSQSAVVHHWSS